MSFGILRHSHPVLCLSTTISSFGLRNVTLTGPQWSKGHPMIEHKRGAHHTDHVESDLFLLSIPLNGTVRTLSAKKNRITQYYESFRADCISLEGPEPPRASSIRTERVDKSTLTHNVGLWFAVSSVLMEEFLYQSSTSIKKDVLNMK